MSIFRTLDAFPVAKAKHAPPAERPTYRQLAAEMRAQASQARSVHAGQELRRLADQYDRLAQLCAKIR
jgi:hypothetical protein